MEADINCLVLGYLKDHDFNRTAREFEQESRYSKRGIMTNQVIGKEYLMPSLSQIVHDYCALKRVERELEKRNKPSCIVSLWKQFDALINQLRLLTIGKQASQSGRKPSYRSVSNAYYTRVSAQVAPHVDNDLSQAGQSHPVGTSSISPSSQESERNVPNSQEPKSKSQQVAKGNEGNVSDLDTSHSAEQASPTRSTCTKDPLICHEDSRSTSDGYTESADSPFRPPDEIAKDEIAKNEFLRSPKRKRIRPKKLENIGNSFSNPDLQSMNDQIQGKDNQIMTQQASNLGQTNSTAGELNAIFDALLSSKSLQEKIADNINKVATSAQVQTDKGAQEAEPFNALSSVDIEEIMNITRSDPTFDSLFATLDDIETCTSSAQIRGSSFESNMTTGANFEPPCDGNIVSEHIEELNSDGDCFANCHEMSDPEPFARIDDCVLAAPSDQKEKQQDSDLAKHASVTIPNFTSSGFQPLQSYPVCNVYIKKKSNLKSGTWRAPASLTNSAILTGSGSMSRARLNQTFGDLSSCKVSGVKETSCKDGQSGKASHVRAAHSGGTMKESCRIQNGSKDIGLLMDHCSDKNVAVLTGRDSNRSRKNCGLDTGSLASAAKCSVDKVKECSTGCEIDSRELDESVETSTRSCHSSYGSHLTLDIGETNSHPNESDHSAGCITKLENQGTVRQRNAFLIDSMADENSHKSTEASVLNKPRTSLNGHRRNRSSRVGISDSDKEINSTENDSGIVNSVQPSDTQFESILSKVDGLGCVDQKHHKRSRLTVRFNLPHETRGALSEGKSEVGNGIRQTIVYGRDDELAMSGVTVQDTLPKKSILKAGNTGRMKLEGEESTCYKESSFQLAGMNLGSSSEIGDTNGLGDERSIMEPVDTTSPFGTLALAHEEVSAKYMSANSCKNSEDTRSNINLECAEKIRFTEDGNLNPMDFKEVQHNTATVVDNRVEYTIEDIKGSRSKSGPMRSKKLGKGNNRQKNSSRKVNVKRINSRQGLPAKENVLDGTRELKFDFQKAGTDNCKAVISMDEPRFVHLEATSHDRMVNGDDKNIHGKRDDATLQLGDSQGDSVEVDIVFETKCGSGETLASVKSLENSTIELENIKDCEGRVIDEKDFLFYSGLNSSTDQRIKNSGIKVDTNIKDLRDLAHGENPIQSVLSDNQLVQNTASKITDVFDKTCHEINRQSGRPSDDISRLSEYDKTPSENIVSSLNTETKSRASGQEDYHDHTMKADKSSDRRITCLPQMQMNENFENVHCDVVAASRMNGLLAENTSVRSPQNNTSRSNVGFEIVSSEMQSEPYDDFISSKNTVENESFKSDIFTIYLSDDSNDSTTISQGTSHRPAGRKSQAESGIMERNDLRQQVTVGRGQVTGIVKGNLGPRSGVVTDGINITESCLRPNTRELIDSSVNNSSCGIGVNAKDSSPDCLGSLSYETRHNHVGNSSESISSFARNDPIEKEIVGQAMAGVGNDVKTKQAGQKSTLASRSKKRKTTQEEVSQPAKKQDKVQNSPHNIEVPKNLNIEDFLSRLKYT